PLADHARAGLLRRRGAALHHRAPAHPDERGAALHRGELRRDRADWVFRLRRADGRAAGRGDRTDLPRRDPAGDSERVTAGRPRGFGRTAPRRGMRAVAAAATALLLAGCVAGAPPPQPRGTAPAVAGAGCPE